MLGWFGTPSCPVTDDERTWIERRFKWLTDQFGRQRLREGTLVLPTTEFFPARYEGTADELAELMVRVARYMDVDPKELRLRFYEDRRPNIEGVWNEGTVGLYSESEGAFDIWLEVSSLADPLAVVATLAHEIGHVLLLGQKRISPEEEDHELLTDLLTVFLGLGIMTANCVIHEHNWRQGNWSGWSVGRRGYMSMNMHGYALALYSLARAEAKPAWTVHLRPDVRHACKRGIRFVRESGQSDYVFSPPRDV